MARWSDNQAVRVDLSCASVELGVPWVMGAAVALSGQLAAFDPNQEGSACWHCVFGEQREPYSIVSRQGC